MLTSKLPPLLFVSRFRIRLDFSLVHLDCSTSTIDRHILNGFYGHHTLHQSCYNQISSSRDLVTFQSLSFGEWYFQRGTIQEYVTFVGFNACFHRLQCLLIIHVPNCHMNQLRPFSITCNLRDVSEEVVMFSQEVNLWSSNEKILNSQHILVPRHNESNELVFKDM